MKMETDHSFEVIVVEETDNPVPIDGTSYVPHPIANRGIPYARNLSLANAKGEIIVFLDDDCIIHDGWIDNLLEPFQDDSIVGVQGGVSVPDDTNAIGWGEAILGFPGGNVRRVLETKAEIQETIEISTLNCAYRKWVIDKVGGFEKRLKLTGEDYVLAKKACSYGRCLFVPKAMVSHEARGSLTKIWSWFVRRGRADIDVIRVGKWQKIHFEWLLKSSLSIKLFLLFLLSIVLHDWAVLLLVLASLAYGTFQYTRCFHVWRKTRSSIVAFLTIPLVKLVMDLAIDWGRMIEIIRNF
jgi:GT2 family glycosyltransferase